MKQNQNKTRPPSSLDVVPEEANIKRRRRKRKTPRYLKIMLAGFGVYLLFSFLLGGYRIWEINKQIMLHNEQKEVLLKQQRDLEKELKALQDPEVIEKLARESLGMVKPGEILIIPAVPGENIPKPK